MKHPQLQKLIDSINNNCSRNTKYQYKDGKYAVLKAQPQKIEITTDNPKLHITLIKILEKILSGNVQGTIDKY